LAGAGGIFVSFLDPTAIFKDKTKLAMAAFGASIALLSIIGLATAGSNFQNATNYSDAFGNRSSVGPGFGAFLALISGLASGILGHINNWTKTDSA
jgi:hypothetical protein